MTKIPLSNVETEQVRDLRARLNRLPQGALGDKSVGPLSKGFFDVCARVGLGQAGTPPAGLDPATLKFAAATAELPALSGLVVALQAARGADPAGWRRWVDQGALQAILTRRLVLAGREPANP